MLYYPQLITGSIGQYPITRRNVRRTIVNSLDDGFEIRTSDSGAARVEWDLGYSQLTLEELNGLRDLFGETWGRWQTFTFLDPTDNLLTWSEDLMQPEWDSDPLIRQTAGILDPFGGNAATRVTNGAQASQQITQQQPAPGGYQYCFSLYIRSDQPTVIELFADDGSLESQADFTAGDSWRRVLHSFAMQSSSDGLTVGFRLAPGQSVYVFGLQLEAQVGAGGYKKTRDRCGVYPKARFDMDALRSTATGMNQYSCSVKIASNVAG